MAADHVDRQRLNAILRDVALKVAPPKGDHERGHWNDDVLGAGRFTSRSFC
jgi:hypothetical protein